MLFSVGLDHAISGGIAHTKKGKPLTHPIFIEKALIVLIHRATHQTAGAGGTGACPAGIGQIHIGLLSRIEDLRVIRARKAGTTLDADVERGHDVEDPEGLVAESAHPSQESWTCNVVP